MGERRGVLASEAKPFDSKYFERSNLLYSCRRCGATILAVRIRRPREGEGPGGGEAK
jgi:hypothetical protein